MGKDEELTALEEFYLAELEQTVNADLISKLHRKEQQIQNQIKEISKEKKDDKGGRLQTLRAQLKKHQSEKRDFPFLKISDKNKDELDELKQLMEVPSHRSKEEVPIGVQPGLDNAIDSIDLSRSILSSSAQSGLLKNLDLLGMTNQPATFSKEMSTSYKLLKERLDLKIDTQYSAQAIDSGRDLDLDGLTLVQMQS